MTRWTDVIRTGQAGTLTEGKVRDGMLNLDAKEFDFLAGDVKTAIQAGRVIDAIKAVRARYNVGLREAKYIADVIRDGGKLGLLVEVDPKLVVIVEEIEVSLRRAIKFAGGDREMLAELVAMRGKVSAMCDRLMGASVAG
jgi:hypothetical protein